MKLSKLLLAGAFAASATSAFAANVTITMTGSTAFRASTMTGIKNYFGAAPDLRIVATNASLNSANQASFSGTVGSDFVTLKCSWSGAMEGVRVVADNSNPVVPNFLTTTALAADTAGDLNHTVVSASTANFAESVVADVAMGDSYQAETGYVPAGGNYSNLIEAPVGVIPFVWVRGKSNVTAHQTSLNAVTNITSLQIQAILGGFAPLKLLTGNVADTAEVKVVGRDYGSGTRLDSFLESGYGRDKDPVQYTFTVLSGAISALTENALPTDGYNSGSFLRTAVGTPTDASAAGVVFSYMGISDASAVSGMTFDNATGTFGGASAAQVLKYNGVTYSHEAVRNGSYTFWNYQVLMHRNTLTGGKLTVVNAIRDQIKNADAAVGGIKFDTMTVVRDGSGKIIL